MVDKHKNRMVVSGVDLFEKYGLVFSDDYTLSLPPFIRNYVEITGRDGPIDFSEVSGDVRYGIREQEFKFFKMPSMTQREFEELKTELATFLHGKKHTYTLGVDPGYTYTGRLEIQADSKFEQDAGFFTIIAEADPYKSKGMFSYKLNAKGGIEIDVAAGRKKVVPIFEVYSRTLISKNERSWYIEPGTHRIRAILLSGESNKLVINNDLDQIYLGRWSDDPDERWEDDKDTRWFVEANNGIPPQTSKTWEHDADETWEVDAESRWYEELYPVESVEGYFYIAFEWKDL